MSLTYFVYVVTNRSGTLYIGVTNDLEKRLYEHREKLVPGFTARYRIDKLVCFETTTDVRAAIDREKELKGWRREKDRSDSKREPILAGLESVMAEQRRDSSPFGLGMTR